MKTIISVILITIVFYPSYNYPQQQQHIPWPSLADSPWPFIRGDMQATGRSKYIGPRTNDVIWRKDMPLGIIYGPIIGDNDILIMGEEQFSPFGENYLYAVDKNGLDIWTFHTETPFANNIAPIVTKDSTIIFGSADLSIYALYPNGELKWRVQNTLWGWPHCFMTLAKNGDLFAPSSDTLVILDQNGVVREKRTIEGLKGRTIIFSMGGDTIFYFTGGGDISVPGKLNAAKPDGQLLWSYDFATHNWGTPLVDNSNKIYVFGTDSAAFRNYYLYCILPDGSLGWRYKIDDYRMWTSPTIDNSGNIIFPAISFENADSKNLIISLDYYGNENWTTVLPGDYVSSLIDHGLVCDAEGKIYLGPTYGGYFYCLSSDGEILWTLDIGTYQYDSSPALGSDGTLYLGTHSGGGAFQEQNLIAIRDTVTSVKNETTEILSYMLEQNFPNPFNSTTKIRYSIPQVGKVKLKVYDLMGSEIAMLLDRYQDAGEYDAIFQPKDLASGIYFYTLTSGNFMATKKLILLK